MFFFRKNGRRRSSFSDSLRRKPVFSSAIHVEFCSVFFGCCVALTWRNGVILPTSSISKYDYIRFALGCSSLLCFLCIRQRTRHGSTNRLLEQRFLSVVGRVCSQSSDCGNFAFCGNAKTCECLPNYAEVNSYCKPSTFVLKMEVSEMGTWGVHGVRNVPRSAWVKTDVC
jgi:hypothetical protein